MESKVKWSAVCWPDGLKLCDIGCCCLFYISTSSNHLISFKISVSACLIFFFFQSRSLFYILDWRLKFCSKRQYFIIARLCASTVCIETVKSSITQTEVAMDLCLVSWASQGFFVLGSMTAWHWQHVNNSEHVVNAAHSHSVYQYILYTALAEMKLIERLWYIAWGQHSLVRTIELPCIVFCARCQSQTITAVWNVLHHVVGLYWFIISAVQKRAEYDPLIKTVNENPTFFWKMYFFRGV